MISGRPTLPVILALGIVLASAGAAAAETAALDDHLRGLRHQIEQGHPERAIAGARDLLKLAALNEHDRKTLLELIADAEYLRAKARHFEDIRAAAAAAETLLKALGGHAPQAADWRWRLAWMHWKHGDLKRAAVLARTILARDQADDRRRRALLLLARIHLAQGQTGEARRQLLQHGLLAADGSRDQALGQAWMALIDFREGRIAPALARLREVMRHHPNVVRRDPELEATWALLLGRTHDPEAIAAARDFLRRHIDRPQAAPVRLMLADLLAADKAPEARAQARKIYALLADEQAETAIGFQAFMRGLMLDLEHETDPPRLRGAMAALGDIARRNQLSPIEDEAMLDTGLIALRLEERADSPPKRSNALASLARAAASSEPGIARRAREAGRDWMARLITRHLDANRDEDALAAVSLWRRWPQFRPAMADAPDLHLRIAHAMRELMLFDAAERILTALQREFDGSVRGQRVMIERARLWLDRGDADGVEKIMRWLNDHPLTLFAPELRLIAAHIQLRRHRLQEARQMLLAIAPDDLALELRAEYWRARGETAERMARWHAAALAWARYRAQQGADRVAGLRHEARALFEEERYARALERLNAMPEAARDDEWRWRAGVCELKTGAIEAGRARLAALRDGAGDDQGEAAHWRLLARLALADLAAKKLIARAQEGGR